MSSHKTNEPTDHPISLSEELHQLNCMPHWWHFKKHKKGGGKHSGCVGRDALWARSTRGGKYMGTPAPARGLPENQLPLSVLHFLTLLHAKNAILFLTTPTVEAVRGGCTSCPCRCLQSHIRMEMVSWELSLLYCLA